MNTINITNPRQSNCFNATRRMFEESHPERWELAAETEEWLKVSTKEIAAPKAGCIVSFWEEPHGFHFLVHTAVLVSDSQLLQKDGPGPLETVYLSETYTWCNKKFHEYIGESNDQTRIHKQRRARGL